MAGLAVAILVEPVEKMLRVASRRQGRIPRISLMSVPDGMAGAVPADAGE